MLPAAFLPFVQGAPFCVMARATLESLFCAERLNELFRTTSQQQYTRELLFSTTIDLLATVVCRIHRSVHAAYQDNEEAVGVSVRSLYDKLAATETGLSEALVRHAAERLRPILPLLQATLPPYVKGYQTKILDGNHLAATEHRIAERPSPAEPGAVPGVVPDRLGPVQRHHVRRPHRPAGRDGPELGPPVEPPRP